MRTRRAVLAATAVVAVALPTAADALVPSSPTPFDLGLQGKGYVDDIARQGGTTYIVGEFSGLLRGGGSGAARSLDPASGRVVPGVPEVSGGTVKAAEPDGAGGVYLGGSFTTVGGTSRAGLAHVLADGSVDPAFDPVVTGSVEALAVSGNSVYAGGNFSEVDGTARPYIAKIENGALDATFAPGPADVPDNTVLALDLAGGALFVGGAFGGFVAKVDPGTGAKVAGFTPSVNGQVWAVAADGSDLFIGGNFATASGESHQNVAKLSATTGTAVTGFTAGTDGGVDALAVSGAAMWIGGQFSTVGGQPQTGVAKLATSDGARDPGFADGTPNHGAATLELVGSSLYVGGRFTEYGSRPRPHLAKVDAASGALDTGFDTGAVGETNLSVAALAATGSTLVAGGDVDGFNLIARRHALAFDAAGNLTAWAPDPSGRSNQVLPAGGSVYISGGFRTVAGTEMTGVAKTDATTGAVDAGFQAQPNDGPVNFFNVEGLALDSHGLYIGGQFTEVGGQPRTHLARVDAATGALDTTFTAQPNNLVSALLLYDDRLFVGGEFTEVNGQPVSARLMALTPATGAVDPTFQAAAEDRSYTLLGQGESLYVGWEATQIGGLPRPWLAKLNRRTGAADPVFAPAPANPNITYAGIPGLALAPDALYVGGYFTKIGGTDRVSLAALDPSTGAALPGFAPAATVGPVGALLYEGSTLYAGGEFDTLAGAPRNGFGSFSSPAAAPGGQPPPTPAAGTTPGKPKLATRPKRRGSARTVKFSFSAAGADGFQCALDGKAFRNCTSPIRYRNLKRGKHAFAVRGVGTAGKPGPSTSYSFTIVRPPLAFSIRFAPNSVALTPAARVRLRKLVAGPLRGRRTIGCTGHTARVSDPPTPLARAISVGRAAAVCGALRSLGVKAKLTVKGVGPSRPAATNRTRSGRARNRRADVVARD